MNYVYPLSYFSVGEQAWVRNAYRRDVFWPAIIVKPEDAPDFVRRLMTPERVCVCFYGPSITQSRPRDYYWAKEGDIVPWSEFMACNQTQQMPKRDVQEAFKLALEEGLSVEAGYVGPYDGVVTSREARLHVDAPRCSTCGNSLSVSEQQIAEQQDGRCGSCQKLYQDGQYCGMCKRVWFPYEKDMACCERCNFWVHTACDKFAFEVVKSGEDRAYLCPPCRDKQQKEEQEELLHCYAVRLRDIKPQKPRSAYQIFSTLMLRQYQEDGFDMDLTALAPLIRDAWRLEEDKIRFERSAQDEAARFDVLKIEYDKIFQEYTALCDSLHQDVELELALEPRQLITGVPRAAAATAARHGAGPVEGSEVPAITYRQRAPGTVAGTGETVKAEDGSSVPQEIAILCNNIKGTFLLASMKVVCHCPDCANVPKEKRVFSPTQYEQHCGAGSAKKWKASIRIEPGSVPECPPGATPMQIGRWFDIKGIETKGAKPVFAFGAAAGTPVIPCGTEASTSASVKTAAGTSTAAAATATAGSTPGAATAVGSGKKAAAAAGGGGDVKAGVKEPSPKTVVKEEPGKKKEAGEWAPWTDVQHGNYKPVKVRWAGDRCCVCDSDIDYDCDQLVSCDGCGITVHQSCYGIPELPGIDDMWLCRACELKEPGKPEPQCCVCPVAGGALKPTTMEGLWCHAACMQWIPEVTCIDPSRMEPIDRIKNIQKERWELQCCVCRQRMGAKIQCNSCYQAYHPLCGRMAGLHMEMQDPVEPGASLQLVSYCPRHCKPNPELSGLTLAKEDEEDDKANDASQQEDTNGLWNGQPFRHPPALPVPTCAAGCARAQRFECQRISHGTGTGCTSLKGFWIPQMPSPAEQAEAELKAAEAAAQRAANKRKRAKGRNKAPSERRVPPPVKAKSAATGDEPPEPSELSPLPDNIPEELPVVCNGRHGVFVTRTQHVKYSGYEYTASRFEHMCGKGDAKKWKCSIWAVNDTGVAEEMMQDWLGSRHLDRVALAKLAANAAAVEAYQEWLKRQQIKAETDTGGEGGNADGQRGNSSMGGGDSDGGSGGQDGRDRSDGISMSAAAGVSSEHVAANGDGIMVDVDGEEAGSMIRVKQEDGMGGELGVPGGVTNRGAAGDAGGEGSAALNVDQTPPPADRAATVQHPIADNGHEASEEEEDARAGKRQRLTYEPAMNGSGAVPPAVAAANAVSNADGALGASTQSKQAVAGDVAPGFISLAAEAAAADNYVAMADPMQTAAADTTPVEPSNTTPVSGVANLVPEAPEAADSTHAEPASKRIKLERIPEDELPDRFRVDATGSTDKQHSPDRSGSPAATPAAGDTTVDETVSAASVPPEQLVGLCCRVYWKDDAEWYDADVRGYDPSTDTHNLWYHMDEMHETINLVEEEKQGRVQWLPSVDKSKWPAPKEYRTTAAPQPSTAATSGPSESAATASLANGHGVHVTATAATTSATAGTSAAGVGNLPGAVATTAADDLAADETLEDKSDESMDEPEEEEPTGGVRVTAMQRDPLDGYSLDLLQASSSHAMMHTIAEQLLWQQQQQQRRYAQYQPRPDQAPYGHHAVGWRVGLLWPDDGCYYYGMITSFHEQTGAHLMQYDDGANEWITFEQETVDWVRADGEASTRAARAVHRAYTEQATLLRQRRAEERLHRQYERVRRRLARKQLLEQKRAQEAHRRQLEQQQQPGPSQPVIKEEDTQAGQQPGSASRPVPRADAPERIGVICASLTGTFDCKRMAVLLDSGKLVTPTEFERLAGKASSKKWKASIRVQKADGRPGITMGDWLIDMGYDAPRTARPPSSAAPSLEEVRRRQIQQRAGGIPGGAPARTAAAATAATTSTADDAGAAGDQGLLGAFRGRSRHRDGCMCVICKQARRKAANMAGVAPDPADAYLPRPGGGRPMQREAGGQFASGSQELRDGYKVFGRAAFMRESKGIGGRAGAPSQRVGKRAYIHAAPQLVRGSQYHKYWAAPVSKAWTPDAWFAAKAAAKAGEGSGGMAGGAAADISTATTNGTPEPPAAGQSSHRDEGNTTGNGIEAMSQNGGASSSKHAAADSETALIPVPASAEFLVIKCERQQKAVTWKERLRQCRMTERERITFGKSGIHGWGIFAKRDMKQDSMVTEFRGELVASLVADIREKKYRVEGRDCYLFHVSDDAVVDSTTRGARGRFTNHCCTPCLYTKVLELDGHIHLCFFARTDIKAGQELTYDYRFKEEPGDSKVKCECGAPNCKGTLN